jgi:hypothetical protein
VLSAGPSPPGCRRAQRQGLWSRTLHPLEALAPTRVTVPILLPVARRPCPDRRTGASAGRAGRLGIVYLLPMHGERWGGSQVGGCQAELPRTRSSATTQLVRQDGADSPQADDDKCTQAFGRQHEVFCKVEEDVVDEVGKSQ